MLPKHYFPLFSIALLAIALSFASELYAAIVILNSLLLFVISTEQTDFVIWFVIYEISVISGFTTLTLESRSYRRIYAFLVMLAATLVSSATFYVLLNSSITNSSGVFLNLLAVLVVFVKVPCFPFSIWLPEAHVEASWPGSVVLAAYALKFSAAIALVFVWKSVSSVGAVVALLLFSAVYAAISMSGTSDFKKLIANFSILHMSASILLLCTASQTTEFLINFSWHHHSIVTGWIFCLVGWAYACSSSRLFRLLFTNSIFLSLGCLVFFVLGTFSLDLPWTSNIFVELGFMGTSISHPYLLGLLCLYFWVFLIAVTISTTAKTTTSTNSTDLGSFAGNFWLSTIALVSAIGFGIEIKFM